ncbi:MAG: hypothetical protein ACO25L_02380 [Candidatus Nanopelagicales bacterium]
MSKKVKMELDLVTAAQIRQVLFESQKGYSYEYPTDRIVNIRKAIEELDARIEKQLETELNNQ